MAIRGPKPHDVPPPQPRPVREQPTSPLQRLLDFGAARTPTEAKKVLAELLASLRSAGFPVAATGSAEGQLGQALQLFQESRGLPPTGILDKETRDALVDAGLLPRPDQAQDAPGATGARQSEAPARFDFDVGVRLRFGPGGELGLPQGTGALPEGGKSARSVELEQLVDKSAQDKPPEVDLKGFLSSLRAAGFAGNGKGAEQLKDSLKKLQRAEGLPASGQLDTPTAEALVRRGIVDERVVSSFAPSASPASAASSATSNDSRASTTEAGPEPTGRGSSGAEGDAAGRSRDAGTGTGTRTGTGTGAGEGEVAEPWSRGSRGNAPAGDEDENDRRRGHANVDDGESAAHAEGHWEVVSLAEQIASGLLAIVRDDDGQGAATYAWDFTLHRPGIYGAKQPAERLFHLVVTRASAFDALWEQAREALNDKLRLVEPEARLVEPEDFARALRQARYREP